MDIWATQASPLQKQATPAASTPRLLYTQPVKNNPGTGGPDARAWLGEKLGELERKRVVLGTLRDSLAAWERDVDWAGLSPAKQQALLALARESVATLKDMIAKLEEEASPAEPPPGGAGSGKDGRHA